MPTIPTQNEIDSVASFVEAVDELEREPFFSTDEPRGIRKTGNQFTFNLGDRFHFRSALITFRRIWMKGDAEKFDDVCNILAKQTVPISDLVDHQRNLVNKAKEKDSVFFIGGVGIKNETLIDL